jgi:hypothetical protein
MPKRMPLAGEALERHLALVSGIGTSPLDAYDTNRGVSYQQNDRHGPPDARSATGIRDNAGQSKCLKSGAFGPIQARSGAGSAAERSADERGGRAQGRNRLDM